MSKIDSEGGRTLEKGHAMPGDIILCKKKSRIWLSVGELFKVERLVVSVLTGKEGVLFIDRFGGERVFWNADEYEVISNVYAGSSAGN